MADLYADYFVAPQEALGLDSQGKRFVFWTVGAGLVIYYFKPSALFTIDGKMKPWTGWDYLQGKERVDPTSTPITFGIVSALTGAVISIL